MGFDPDEEPFFDDGPDAWDDPPPPIDGIQEAIRATRNRNFCDGQVALAVLHELRTTSPRECLTARTLVAGEIGPALRLGPGAALKLVDTVLALQSRLRVTFAAVCRGDLPWYYATVLAERTAPLTDDQARAVEADVLGRASGQTPARFTDSLRRAVDRIDPAGADARRQQAKKDVRLIRAHYGDGMGTLFARLGSEQLDTVWTGADYWARARKADGDPRTLDQLRVAALVQWAQSYLHHGDPTYCDRWCTPHTHAGAPADTDDDNDGDGGPDDDGGPDGDGGLDGDGGPDSDGSDSGSGGADEDGGPDGDGPEDESADISDDRPGCEHRQDQPPVSRPPTRHGRPAALHVLWDLPSLLGLASRCGELADSGATLPPEAMRELLAGGVAIRRMLIHADNGELVDLTPHTWTLPRTQQTELAAPVELRVLIDKPTWQAITDGTADPDLLAAITAAHPAVRDMLAHPCTADDLDATPAAYPAPTRLAEFIAVRDRHPVNPTAGPTAAAAADLDHTEPYGQGGRTTRHALASTTRYWHRLKTHGGWQVQRNGRGWQWTSPHGRTYTTQPYDYRLGP